MTTQPFSLGGLETACRLFESSQSSHGVSKLTVRLLSHLLWVVLNLNTKTNGTTQ